MVRPFLATGLVALTMGVAALGATAARADEPNPDSLAPREPRYVAKTWYGWQTLLADAASVGAGLATKNGYVFVAGYVLGAPIVHAAHGEAGSPGKSVAMRVGFPIGGMLIGLAASSGCDSSKDWFCQVEGAAYGVLGGMIVASLTDAFGLAWEPSRRSVTGSETPHVSIAPGATMIPGGSLWGVTGAF